MTHAAHNLYLGVVADASFTLNGTIADAAVWSFGLSPAEVAADYAARKAAVMAAHPSVSLP
jgi:hypothetical protein